MSAAQTPESGDDIMAIADAVGVNATPTTAPSPTPLGGDVAHLLTDPSLDAVLSAWSRAAANVETDLSDESCDAWLADCTMCSDTGLITVIDRIGMFTATCPSCRGLGGALR